MKVQNQHLSLTSWWKMMQNPEKNLQTICAKNWRICSLAMKNVIWQVSYVTWEVRVLWRVITPELSTEIFILKVWLFLTFIWPRFDLIFTDPSSQFVRNADKHPDWLLRSQNVSRINHAKYWIWGFDHGIFPRNQLNQPTVTHCKGFKKN